MIPRDDALTAQPYPPQADDGISFEIIARDVVTSARTGRLHTRRGDVPTPAFMPVGTQASVKSLTPSDVEATGTQIILSNTYHLMLRPGVDLLRAAGGLHRFMGWPGPILTDSGGFQVFSLANRRVVSEEGVAFRSHIDGSARALTPESAIELQLGFGSDIMMPLDQLVGFANSDTEQQAAMDRTCRWLSRALDRFRSLTGEVANRPLLFGIAQGGFNVERRLESAQYVSDLAVDGSAIGGLSVGEPKQIMAEMLEASIAGLPPGRPRYLMGVGSPEDLWRGVAAGVDMFDCVHPTRVARRGHLFTLGGRVNVTASRFRDVFGPVDPECDCLTCTSFSAAYLHHLFRAGELLAYRLASIHNLRFVQRQMEQIRESIALGSFEPSLRRFLDSYRPARADESGRRLDRRNRLDAQRRTSHARS